MLRRALAITLVTCFVGQLHAQSRDPLTELAAGLGHTSAVTGREDEARNFIRSLFPDGTFQEDKLGNLVFVIGSGSPRKLLTAPLDEPGYVVSSIKDDGYLRITPIGYGHVGNMYHQFLQGNEIRIGDRKGVAIVPSSHYEGLRLVRESTRGVHPWQETVIDVGMASPQEVAEAGIRLLDPLTANKKMSIVDRNFVAAPAMGSKAALAALATVVETLRQGKVKGTTVVAFTTLELINGKGLEAVVTKFGPFDQVVRFNRFLNESPDARNVLVDKDLPFTTTRETPARSASGFRASFVSADWDSTKFFGLGLPVQYAHTPVEMVHRDAMTQLVQTWLQAVEAKTWKLSVPTSKGSTANAPTFQSHQEESALLSKLVSNYGVSGSEKPVRDFILSQLPKWAKPQVDGHGNVIVHFGKGQEHVAFVAHMDEVGYVVDSIRADGRLTLKQRGGFFNHVWEGHAAIIHAKANDIAALFEPRMDYLRSTTRSNGNKAPTVFAGFTSRAQAIEAGVEVGSTTVTMPKQMIRLSETKATARGFDDRVGCATLLRVIQNINPETLTKRITFVWSTEEETGLTGSTFAANSLTDVSVVYPIDTFVSSDDPVDPRLFGYCPLGNGAVIRVIESINIVPRRHFEYLQELAATKSIKVQSGMTAGGTDGLGFLKYEIPSVPLSWPGRYSHSPVEIMDFRDMSALIALVTAIVSDGPK